MITSKQCKIARCGLGLTRDELVKLSHVSKRTIISFEAGKTNPIPATRAALERAFLDLDVEFGSDKVCIPVRETMLASNENSKP